MKPIPLFGTGVDSYSKVVTAQRRLNCFYDIREDGDARNVILRGTPGSKVWATLPTMPLHQWHAIGDTMYAISGTSFYQVSSSGTYSLVGTIPGIGSSPQMQDNGVQIIIVDGTAGYIYTILTGVISTITDVNFPNGCTSVAFLDGRFIVNVPATREYAVSGSYDGTLWTPFIFATKEDSSDPLLGVTVWNGYLILLGQSSLEFWQDVGASPNPFQKITGATQSWGIAAINSIEVLNDALVFLGRDPAGGLRVMQVAQTKAEPISTTDINDILDSFVQSGTTFTDAVSLTFTEAGHSFYMITFPTAGRSLIYDSSSQFWGEMQTGTDVRAAHFSRLGITFNYKNLFSDGSTGNIYAFDDKTYSDNGSAIKRQVVSRHVSRGGSHLAISEIELDMETGVGLPSGQGSDPQITMEISRDRGRTFAAPRSKSIGQIGQYRQPRVTWRRCGQAEDFVFRFTMTDPVKFTVLGGNATVVDGTDTE